MTRRHRRELGAVFLGGMIGAVLRVWISDALPATATQWPWGIFLINISGTVALAFLATWLQERPEREDRRHRPPYLWPLLGPGLCGAYTTFSTMQVEILRMLDHDCYGLAAGYTVASVAAGLAAIRVTTARARGPRLR